MRQLTLPCMIILLLVVIGINYYLVREGFKSSTKGSSVKDSSGNDVSSDDTDTDTDTDADTDADTTDTTDTTDSADTEKKSKKSKDDTTTSSDSMNEMTPVATAKQGQANLLKNIRQIVQNELAKLRVSSPVVPSSAPLSDDNAVSTKQGQEYMSRCPKDMSQYIRKNAIPCWGCTLPQ
jgi:cytoskeletal protein RodZ